MRVPEMTLWGSELDDGAPESQGEVTREFLVADVFTSNALEGNQLGIFPDGRGLPAELMLKATRELNFSETVFFLPPADPDQADAHVRIFTPGGELPFAGHPTLGSAWVLGELLGRGRGIAIADGLSGVTGELRSGARAVPSQAGTSRSSRGAHSATEAERGLVSGRAGSTVTLQLGAGLVPVELERDAEGRITFGWMSQPLPRLDGPYPRAAELIEALGTPPRQDGLPIETYVNGPVNVYVEFADEKTVAGLVPDMQRLARIPANVSCFAQGPGRVTTRMFAPALAVHEDPATGSAAGPLALHLARHGRIAFGEEIEIRQGEQIQRPSVLYARAEGSAEKADRVIVGGRAVVVAHGLYRLR